MTVWASSARHRQKKMACQWQFAFQIVTSVVLTGPATTKFWNSRLLLGCHSTAMWDLCETWVFLAAGSWKFLFSGLVCLCMSSCIALLSPEVRWTGLFPWFRPLGCLYVVKWMGSSTHLFSIEMNVEVSTSVVRWVVGGLFTLGTLLFRWGAVLRGIWVAGLFHLLLGSFCCFTALFPNDTVIRPIRCFCFKKVHPCAVKSDAWAIWAKPCLLHLIVFPFLWLLCTFALR